MRDAALTWTSDLDSSSEPSSSSSSSSSSLSTPRPSSLSNSVTKREDTGFHPCPTEGILHFVDDNESKVGLTSNNDAENDDDDDGAAAAESDEEDEANKDGDEDDDQHDDHEKYDNIEVKIDDDEKFTCYLEAAKKMKAIKRIFETVEARREQENEHALGTDSTEGNRPAAPIDRVNDHPWIVHLYNLQRYDDDDDAEEDGDGGDDEDANNDSSSSSSCRCSILGVLSDGQYQCLGVVFPSLSLSASIDTSSRNSIVPRDTTECILAIHGFVVTPAAAEHVACQVGDGPCESSWVCAVTSTSVRPTQQLQNATSSISDFLEQHATIMALRERQNKSSNPLLVSELTFSGGHSKIDVLQNYSISVNEFANLQRQEIKERSKPMPSTETDEEDALLESPILSISSIQAHAQASETLDYALQCREESLSPELLLRWHAWLMGDGLHVEAGNLRSRPEHEDWIGWQTCPADLVPSLISKLCKTLEDGWLRLVKDQPSAGERVVAFVAFVMLAFYDIQPFEEGNVDLVQILFQWTLVRAGFPFCVPLFTDRTQKNDFLDALELAGENLYLLPGGEARDADISIVLQFTNGIAALAGYVAERMAKAIDEFTVLLAKKAKCVCEETEARVARRAREKAAKAMCMICFDENPNIGTLCCGKPVHFNCLGEWLKSHPTCPQCRSGLPSLTPNARGTQLSNTIINASEDDNSIADSVDMLLHYITNESADDVDSSNSSSSSSSSDSSSSSSSSSSNSEAFVYDTLNYSLNYITSDEEDEGDNSSSTNTHLDGNETENYDAPHEHTFYRRSETSARSQGEDDLGIVQPVQLVGGIESGSHDDGTEDLTTTSPGSGGLAAPYSPRFHDASESENQSTETSYMSATEYHPRLSFLDQTLLDDVNYGIARSHATDHEYIGQEASRRPFDFSAFLADSSSTDEEETYLDDDIPGFARPRERALRTDRILSNIASRSAAQRATLTGALSGGTWIPSRLHRSSDSEGYDSETYGDVADDEHLTTEDDSTVAPPSPPPYRRPTPLFAFSQGRIMSGNGAFLSGVPSDDACTTLTNEEVSFTEIDSEA